MRHLLWVPGHIGKDTLGHPADGLAGMRQRAFQQGEVIAIAGAGILKRQRLMIHTVAIVLHLTGEPVTAADRVDPAGQAQQGEGAGYGFVGGFLRMRHAGQEAAQVLVAQQRGDTIFGCRCTQDHPGIALQWCQALIEQQPHGEVLMGGNGVGFE